MKMKKKILTTVASFASVVALVGTTPFISSCSCFGGGGGGGGDEPTTKYWTITFNSDGAGSIPSESVKDGDKAVKPEIPSPPEGKVLDGWYSDAARTKKYTFNNPVKADITLYAKWVDAPTPIQYWTITFNSMGGTPIPSESVKDGDKAVKPESPTPPEGKALDGWYDNASYTGNPFDFINTPITASMTLYAKWVDAPIPTQYWTVTFNSMGGTPIPSETVKNGEFAVRPADPEPKEAGKILEGWFRDGYASAFDFINTPITSDITLVARWINPPTPPTQYWTITFITYNESIVIPTETVKDGDLAIKPANPEWIGPDPGPEGTPTFQHWCIDSTEGQEYLFNSPVTSNITLHALWDPPIVNTYAINLTQTDNGKITCKDEAGQSRKSAKQNETLIFTMTPNTKAYRIACLCIDTEVIDPTKIVIDPTTGAGTYEFTMPGHDINVTGYFVGTRETLVWADAGDTYEGYEPNYFVNQADPTDHTIRSFNKICQENTQLEKAVIPVPECGAKMEETKPNLGFDCWCKYDESETRHEGERLPFTTQLSGPFYHIIATYMEVVSGGLFYIEPEDKFVESGYEQRFNFKIHYTGTDNLTLGVRSKAGYENKYVSCTNIVYTKNSNRRPDFGLYENNKLIRTFTPGLNDTEFSIWFPMDSGTMDATFTMIFSFPQEDGTQYYQEIPGLRTLKHYMPK